jgi:hypothetical protein
MVTRYQDESNVLRVHRDRSHFDTPPFRQPPQSTMTPRLADVPRREDPSVGPSSKHPFNREPLLIPQLFVDGKPWYRRRATVTKIALATFGVAAVTFVVRHYTAERLLRAFAKLAR